MVVGVFCSLLMLAVLSIIGNFTGLSRVLDEMATALYVGVGEILMVYTVTPFSARILGRGETNNLFFSILSAVCFLVIQSLFYLPGASDGPYILYGIVFVIVVTTIFFWRTKRALEHI